MLSGKVALITGAGRGIGRAVALAMAQAGADVAVLYNGSRTAAEETAAQIEGMGRRAGVFQCDVGDYEGSKAAVAAVLGHFGRVDILVNNAGITRDALILSMKPADFTAVLQTNLTGTFHMTRHLYPHFLRQRSGRIINISSVSGLLGNAGQANYAAAKAGVIGLTKTTARELASRGITCNAIAPGYIDTDMTAALPAQVAESVVAQIPLGRMGRAEEVAAAAVFLAGDTASYITGTVLQIDGGLCM
ncbi:MAG: 3-oxoacyl-[acyl-carrier-protein] reductase [Clostridiales bacterium]|nr:3-oxoacyl-[acyl-carrier-protein] reductase [Clostridiales bacterium]